MRKPPNERLTRDRRSEGSTATAREAGAAVAERRCILTGEHAGRDDLLRLVLGPDHRVHPDVRARAPGRGAWIGVDRATLEQAQAKGKLKAALARSFRRSDFEVAPDLAQRIEEALRQLALDRLGLEARSGKLVTGSEKIEVAARRGQVHLLIHAADAAPEGRRRLDQAWRIGSDAEGSGLQGLVFPLGRSILSLALGRENVVHAAIVDGGAARRVRRAVDRWRAFIGREAGLGAASAEAPGEREVDVGEGLE